MRNEELPIRFPPLLHSSFIEHSFNDMENMSAPHGKPGTQPKNKTLAGKTGKKKTATGKRAAVVEPRLTNVMKPQGMSLEEWQIALRKLQAEKETFAISVVDETYSPGEYCVVNATTRNKYKVVYRGQDSIWNYCSCMDFKTSQLGTCKHLEAVKMWTKNKRKKIHKEAPDYSSVYLSYVGPRCVKIRLGEDPEGVLAALAREYFDENGVIREETYGKFEMFLHAAKTVDPNFRCYDDALDYIVEQRESMRRARLVESKYDGPTLDTLLTVKLYPYQKEGVRFAVKAGKAIIADEMGLGKTVQAIAAAEIYLREGMADNVLVVCPTSLKYQWKKEIEKFTGTDREGTDSREDDVVCRCPKVIVVEGNPFRRQKLYRSKALYKIVSYNTMCNDVRELGKLTTDVLIMDEIQRLKNWNTLISRAARKIESRYAVLLSGTPMENKLEELYANIELVDQFCLGPFYKFRDNHILLHPEKGSIVGYKNLNEIGNQIKHRLIRRTKKGVCLQLPERSDQYILVPMTSAQSDYHEEFKAEVCRLLQKYKRLHYMSEQDRLRLMMLLGQMRMVADSTFILEQNLQTRADVKIAEVMNLLDSVFDNGDEKVVIFSEWERMARLVAIELEKRKIRYEYLCGKVSAKQRGQLVEYFNTLPESRVFISTDAGSTGLNLQAASILINLDLPWNPAVLEQRVARIFRIGQERPVQIINLVSKDSFEEGMIDKLRFKTSMFEGVLDGGADAVFVGDDKFKQFLEDVSCVLDDTPEPPVVDYIDDDTEDTLPIEATAPASDLDSAGEQLPAEERGEGMPSPQSPTPDDVPAAPADAEPHSSTVHSHAAMSANPEQLVSQGISFFAGLAEVLKSPASTKQLVDHLVEVNEETGEANIKIPVANKETVFQMFSMLGKLMQG